MFAWLSGVFRNVASCLQRPQRPAKHEGGDQKVQESELKELPFLDLAGSEQQELKLRTQPSSAHLDGTTTTSSSATPAAANVGLEQQAEQEPRLARLSNEAMLQNPSANSSSSATVVPTVSLHAGKAATDAPALFIDKHSEDLLAKTPCRPPLPEPSSGLLPTPPTQPPVLSFTPIHMPYAAAMRSQHGACEQQENRTPLQHPLQDAASFPSAAAHVTGMVTPSPVPARPVGRFVLDSGKVVGVDNTVARYHPAKVVVPHLTPFAERVTREMEAEQAVVALRERMAAAGGAAGARARQ